MHALFIIEKKRDGKKLDHGEIKYMVDGYHRGEIPDYQMSAFLMAFFIRGFNTEELNAYTSALLYSGRIMNWKELAGPVGDKHSSGGVGDNTSLIVVPLLAAAGVYMPKMSGRGLGHTGGTIDKLESVPGFNAGFSKGEFADQVKDIGLGIIGQTGELAPADGKIYALRDVTGTVDSIPLIAASIMSKKIAGGAHGVVLDVKTGSGAFMRTIEEAEQLARTMVELGEGMGQNAVAVISDMNQPLGRKVGNALEIEEAREVLQGEGPGDVRELSLVLGANLLKLLGKTDTLEKGYSRLEKLLDEGEGWNKFKQMVVRQGGNISFVERGVPEAYCVSTIYAEHDGFVSSMEALHLGKSAALLGAGRFKKGDPVDPYAGLVLHAKVGDKIEKEEPLVSLYSGSCGGDLKEAENEAVRAASVSRIKIEKPSLIKY